MANLDQLVVKPANETGGYGVMIGPQASKKERDAVAEKIQKPPRDYFAQPTLSLSTVPTYCDGRIEPRHIDLRPFVLSGERSYVTKGGLRPAIFLLSERRWLLLRPAGGNRSDVAGSGKNSHEAAAGIEHKRWPPLMRAPQGFCVPVPLVMKFEMFAVQLVGPGGGASA